MAKHIARMAALLAFVLALVPMAFAFAAEESGSTAASSEASASSGAASSSAAAASSEAAPPATSVDTSEENLVDPAQRADNSFIYDTTIESLFDEASLYDGRTVQVTGEAIGDLISAQDADGNYWVTLTTPDIDNPSTISVLMSEDQVKQIDHFGRYGVTGTRLQVRGEYHQACSEHDGLPDVHATNSAVLLRGTEHPDEFQAADYLPGILTMLIGAGLLALYYIARERAR